MANIKHPNQPSEEELNSFLSKVDELDDVLKGLNSTDQNEQIQYTTKADKLIEKFEAEKSKKENDATEDDLDLPKTSIGFSKTSINKEAYKNDQPQNVTNSPALPDQQVPIDQKAFMAYMEADAKERYERKKAAEKVASGLKEQGNTAFRQGKYQEALGFYDKAIHEVRDSSVLYTNRAQAKIKLGMFQEALSDCDWALRAWPNCMKAYVHQGHANLGLHKWDEARESYKSILSLDPKKQAIVKDYLAEVDRSEKAAREEEEAVRLFEDGNEAAQGIVDLLTRVHKSEQLPLFYAGGFRVIAGLLNDTNSQTLFRTNNGLKIPETHAVMKRYLSACTASLSREERDVLSAALDMLTAACKENETNQQQLLALSAFPSQLLTLLEVKVKGQGRQLRSSCLQLLYEISLTEAGRLALVGSMNVERLTKVLFPLMMKKTSGYASTAAALLNNIALEKRLKTLLRDNIEESVLPAFEDLVSNNKTSPEIAGIACSTATNLAADQKIRNKMAARANLWQALANLMLTCNEISWKDTVHNVLGLLVNLSTGVESAHLTSLSTHLTSALYEVLIKAQPEPPSTVGASSHSSSSASSSSTSAAAATKAASFSSSSSSSTPSADTSCEALSNEGQDSTSAKVSNGHTTGESPGRVGAMEKTETDCSVRDVGARSLQVLSNILPVNKVAATFMSSEEKAQRILGFVKCPDTSLSKPALKCLTALTQSSYTVRKLVACNKGLSTLLSSLMDPDETVAGNAALCLSHLTKNEDAGDGDSDKQSLGTQVCAKLTKTNIVQKLLTLARDGRKSALQANCAILLGKLAYGDQKHLEKLRELHGLQILHECMKHVKQ